MDGLVLIDRGVIAAVGQRKSVALPRDCPVQDLGERLLLPGFVNPHCHLDYTDMAGQIPPAKTFPEWINAILALKAEWGYSEYALSWLAGARMLLRSGTTTVGDIEAVPELLPQVWASTPMRVISFLEMTGVRGRREPETVLREALEVISALPLDHCCAMLGPHAPYSTSSVLLRLAAQVAHSHQWPLTIHLSESAEEFEMFMHGKGVMFDWLRRNQRNMSDCGLGSPVQHLERLGVLGSNLLAVHVNYLAHGDAETLAKRRVSVVHCPRSHHYFRHARFPFDELDALGINICLGTDSLATVWRIPGHRPTLSMFAEMQAFASSSPGVSPALILKMATLNGARALGLAGKVGEITEGAAADLIAMPFHGDSAGACASIVHERNDPDGVMIAGRWMVAPS